MEHEPSYCRFCGDELTTRSKEGKERFYCNGCERFLWQDPSPATGVIVEKEGKWLLIKRGLEPWKGKWSIPAGYMEIDEKPVKTAARELKEETGIKVSTEGLTPFGNMAMEHPDGKRVVAIIYKAEDFEGELDPGPEPLEAGFIDPNKIDMAPLLEWCREREKG